MLIMNINNPAEKVWCNSDLKNIIEDFLRCIWCKKVPYNYYSNTGFFILNCNIKL